MVTNGEPQISDMLDAVSTLSTHMDERFDRLEERVGKVEERVGKVETTMVTKDYLDEKLSDLRGDFTVLMRKGDRKVRRLIEVLLKKRVLADQEAHELLALEPFPEILV